MIVDLTIFATMAFLLWENNAQRKLISELTSKVMARNYYDYSSATRPVVMPKPRENLDPIEDIGHIQDFTVR